MTGIEKQAFEEIKELEVLIHNSLGVEGAVEFERKTVISLGKSTYLGFLFKVTDSKRGVFFIGWYK